MQRFLLLNFFPTEKFILEDKDIIYQCVKVLRLREWSEMILFNGKTQIDYVYKIESIDKKSFSLSLQEEISKKSELHFHLVLFQALPNKISKLEYIVQKCSEVGFSEIVFFPSERSQKLIISDNKKERLTSIMKEAIEQSWRNKVCKVSFQQDHIVDTGDVNIIFYEELNTDSKKIQDISIKKDQTAHIVVWPEWGFSEKEIEAFESQRFQKVYLGERILRCETAGVVTGFCLSQLY